MQTERLETAGVLVNRKIRDSRSSCKQNTLDSRSTRKQNTLDSRSTRKQNTIDSRSTRKQKYYRQQEYSQTERLEKSVVPDNRRGCTEITHVNGEIYYYTTMKALKFCHYRASRQEKW